MTITIKDKPHTVVEGLRFTECPRWRDGWLYFSDMWGGTVYRVDEAGTLETVCAVPGRPGGIGWATNGDLIVNEMATGHLLRLVDGELRLHADVSSIAKTGINDMIVAPSGIAYSGKYCHDFPPPADPLILIDDAGNWREAGDPLDIANGIILTADGKTLLVAESAGMKISAFDIADDGTPINKRLFAQMPHMYIPDGICADDQGGVWATCCLGPGIVRVIEGGEITHLIPFADGRFAYACAFGGANRQTLYICSAGKYDPDNQGTTTTAKIEAIRLPFTGSGIP
jgi:sugar lactone lactonase YvrE